MDKVRPETRPQTQSQTAPRQSQQGQRDAAARAKDIMARFPRTIARLAK